MKGLRLATMISNLIFSHFSFYLVTWMKGLRLFICLFYPFFHFSFLPCDLNEGITTRSPVWFIDCKSFVFTLWPEWRDYDQDLLFVLEAVYNLVFTLWPEWRDYDVFDLPFLAKVWLIVFTLWPEWRDYDCLFSPGLCPGIYRFLPCDLNEGITTTFLLGKNLILDR